MHYLPGTGKSIGDIIPVDYVSNSIILCIAKFGEMHNDLRILQCGTSVIKPAQWIEIRDILIPLIHADYSIKNSIRSAFVYFIENDKRLNYSRYITEKLPI